MKHLKLIATVIAVMVLLSALTVPVFASATIDTEAAPNASTTQQGDAAGTDSQGTAKKNNTWMNILQLGVPILVLVAFFYFGMYRPQKKQEKEKKEMMESMQVGASVTTNGGIIGRIVSIKDDDVTIESGADKTKFQIAKWAIVTVKKPGEEE